MDGNITLAGRTALYGSAFPKYPPLVATDKWLYGWWAVGNNYRSRTQYYGEYPRSYLERVMSLFPDALSVLHVFAGRVRDNPAFRGQTMDCDATLSPNYPCRAENAASLAPKSFDLLVADPPYSADDAAHYGFSMPDRRKVIAALAAIAEPGGFCVWLDVMTPQYHSRQWGMCGLIGLYLGVNRRMRVATLLQRKGG